MVIVGMAQKDGSMISGERRNYAGPDWFFGE